MKLMCSTCNLLFHLTLNKIILIQMLPATFLNIYDSLQTLFLTGAVSYSSSTALKTQRVCCLVLLFPLAAGSSDKIRCDFQHTF